MFKNNSLKIFAGEVISNNAPLYVQSECMLYSSYNLDIYIYHYDAPTLFLCLHTASVHKEWDEVLNASLGPHETFRYNLVIGFGIALNICIMKGQIDIYATIFIPNPSKVFNEWHLQLEESENDTVCKTLQMETGEDSEAARRRRRQLPASAYKNLYISVTGGAAENVFVVNTSTLVETDDTTPDNSTTNGPTGIIKKQLCYQLQQE